MTLNFKILRRSFSLRNNVSEDREDKNVPNLLKESVQPNGIYSDVNSTVDGVAKIKLKPNLLDDNRVFYTHEEALHINMEYLMPYTRPKSVAPAGMQLTRIKKNGPERDLNSINSSTNPLTNTSATSDVNFNSKKLQKQVLQEQIKHFKSSSEVDFSPTKMSKKQLKMAQEQLKKLTKINIHLHALFSAVENGQSEKAKSILESTDVNVNCINGDALSPLDVAVLSNNRPLTKILLQHGAIHGAEFKNCDSLGNHLNSLLEAALNKINDFTCVSADDLGENDADKQIDFWQRRANSLQRVLRGWIQTSTPYLPQSLIVEVTSTNSVSVRVQESHSGAITTKFKIQWSITPDFGNVIDEREINDLTSIQGIMYSTLHLYNLIQGQRYFFRAFSGNIKGWSECRLSSPESVIPSSWKDAFKKDVTVKKQSLDELLTKVRTFRAMSSSEIEIDAPVCQGIAMKKKATIKQLFTATSKFQKHLKRGIYLACLLYHDGKVLVTNDDLLPVIEIDENYPNNFYCELPWLMKISCNWDMVKSARNEMEKYSTSVNQFRIKLLSAISQMQSAIGLKDLGHFYCKSLQDTRGTVVLSCINYIKHPKSISVLNSRWIPLRKIQKKLMPLNDESSINEVILTSIQNQIEFHQAVSVKLSKGLYIGYLKMHCSMEQMHIVVPTKTPNVLPHCKIRDNPHVCAEEWTTILEAPNQKQLSKMQKHFLDTVSSAAMRVFKFMGIPTECMLKHKLYDLELVKLSADVSFLVICPPIELSCAAPGQRERLLQRADLVSLPTQVFEMCQLFTYDNDKIRKCARLSVVLDLESAEANHRHREAFSTVEAQAAKEHLHKLQELKTQLADFWKDIRWLMEVMTFTRNRCTDTGISMRYILNVEAQQNVEKTDDLLVLRSGRANALTRRSPCRFSWPNTNMNKFRTSELSKSDQQLNFVMSNRHCKGITAVDSSRRNSADAHCFHSSEEANNFLLNYLPLCKSDETLSTSKPSFSPLLHRKRSKTVNDRTCSTRCVKCENASTSTRTDISESTGTTTQPESLNVTSYSNRNRLSEFGCKIDGQIDKENLRNVDNIVSVNSPQFGTIQVYVANETGVANGICLKLHVTTATTAREIIDLVVKQLNQNFLLNGEVKQICNELKAKDFCLFAIFGTRGRCVPDNFRPLQLQNPWEKGRLYVRRTNDIVAEIEHSKRDLHVI